MLVPYLSASRLKTAQDCYLKYHYHYEQPNADAQALKEIGNHRDNSQAGRMGNNVHDALEEWRRPDPETGKTPKPSFGRLMTLYKEINAKREVDFNFYEDGKRMLKRWFDRRGRDPVRALHVEMQFGRHDAPYMLSRTGTPVLGFIDLVIEHRDGTIECIDYKTQRLDITQAEADNSIQAAIYLCVARELWPDRPIQFTFDLQRHGTVTTVWTDERLEDFKDWLHSQYENIMAVDSTDTTKVPATIGKGCQWCAYTPICPKAQDMMQNGAWDMLTPTLGADLNDLLNELATIKASKQMLDKRKKAIDAHIKEEVFDRSMKVEDCKTETENWSVEWREQTRRSYIPTEVQKLVPPTVFGTMVSLSNAAVDRVLPILPDDVAEAIKRTQISKPQRMLIVKPKESGDDGEN
ncbi:MAG: hypothetical protein CMF52_09375 [Legionellales bacterium]|nr:hypothetical protein [Legionellales bacterium]